MFFALICPFEIFQNIQLERKITHLSPEHGDAEYLSGSPAHCLAVNRSFSSLFFHPPPTHPFVLIMTTVSEASPMTTGKESACNAGDTGDTGSVPEWGRSPGEGNGNHSSILAWKIPWREEPGGLWSNGLQSVGPTEQLNTSTVIVVLNSSTLCGGVHTHKKMRCGPLVAQYFNQSLLYSLGTQINQYVLFGALHIGGPCLSGSLY